jgi:uncharacterized protein YbjT (DUF2867 family)
MATQKQITIIGATGQLGRRISSYLVKFGAEVTVIARNTEKAESLFKENNVNIVYGDITKPESLKAALANTAYLYLNLSTNTLDFNTSFAEEREGIQNILDAVDKKTIKQILCISGLGALQTDMVPDKYAFVPNLIRSEGHKLLRNSGIPYTILHCTWFADSFALFQRKGTYSVLGNNANPIYFTNTFDFSQHLFNAIANENAFNKDYPIQGKEGKSHMEAAKAFLKIYDPNVKVSILPDGVIHILALFMKEMKLVKAMSRYFKHANEKFIADKSTFIDLGKPLLSVEEFAEKLKNEHA